jgi:hypothetical protein
LKSSFQKGERNRKQSRFQALCSIRLECFLKLLAFILKSFLSRGL